MAMYGPTPDAYLCAVRLLTRGGRAAKEVHKVSPLFSRHAFTAQAPAARLDQDRGGAVPLPKIELNTQILNETALFNEGLWVPRSIPERATAMFRPESSEVNSS